MGLLAQLSMWYKKEDKDLQFICGLRIAGMLRRWYCCDLILNPCEELLLYGLHHFIDGSLPFFLNFMFPVASLSLWRRFWKGQNLVIVNFIHPVS